MIHSPKAERLAVQISAQSPSTGPYRLTVQLCDLCGESATRGHTGGDMGEEQAFLLSN